MKENFWKQFADEIEGNFIEGQFGKSDKVELKYKKWKVEFDNFTEYRNSGNKTFEANYTRILSLIISKDNFQFEIYKSNFFSSVSKIFGGQDVEIGYEEFDRKFIVKTNNEQKVKSLLRSKIRLKIQEVKMENFQISDQHGIWEKKLNDNNFELSIFIDGISKDDENLKSIFSLFQLTLDHLKETNSIE